jgi:hypothetical protein
VILLHERSEKLISVSSQQSAGKLGTIFNQNSFAISIQKLVAHA